jgi:hypothetical protein
MDAFPLPQEEVRPFGHLGDQASQGRSPDADSVYHLGRTVWPTKMVLRLSRPRDVDMRRRMIERAYDEPEAVRTMDDNRGRISSDNEARQGWPADRRGAGRANS